MYVSSKNEEGRASFQLEYKYNMNYQPTSNQLSKPSHRPKILREKQHHNFCMCMLQKKSDRDMNQLRCKKSCDGITWVKEEEEEEGDP